MTKYILFSFCLVLIYPLGVDLHLTGLTAIANDLNASEVTLPLPLPHSVSEQLDISFILLWHKRHAYNSKVLWLRETIKNSVNQFMQKNSR